MSDIIQVKIVLIGDVQVGKTCIISRYVTQNFEDYTTATLGVSFLSKIVEVNNKKLKLHIWDSAGQERFGSLTKLYSRDAEIILLVYDVTSRKSFARMKNMYRELDMKECEDSVILIVVGNKEDLIEREEVDLAEALRFAESINGQFFKTSAKTNYGIDDMFFSACEKFLIRGKMANRKTVILDRTSTEQKKKSCCE